MAGGQGATGGRSPPPKLDDIEDGLAIRFHSWVQLEAILHVDQISPQNLVPVTAEHLAFSLGVGALAAMEKRAGAYILVDVDDVPGRALGAMRSGCRWILFRGRELIAIKLEGMLDQINGRLERQMTLTEITLDAFEDAERTLISRLGLRKSCV